MPIEFHCPYCGKQIRAADEHGGKHGKCPSCHQKVYVPTAPDQIEPLKLAPVDEAFAREQARLMRETHDLTHKILHERETPDSKGPRPAGGPAAPAGTPPAARAEPPAPRVDVEHLVVEYAVCMADGNLDEAREIADDLRPHARQVNEVVQRLLMDEIPPQQLARIPRPVLNGFLKQLAK
jgi:hypothetical protein